MMTVNLELESDDCESGTRVMTVNLELESDDCESGTKE